MLLNKYYTPLLLSILLLSTFSCSYVYSIGNSTICDQKYQLQKAIEKDWVYAEELLSSKPDSAYLIYDRIDSLARICPELLADFLIGSNAQAANIPTDFSYKKTEYYLQKGEKALSQYEEFLSKEKILDTKMTLLYGRCRFNDLQGNLEQALACYEAIWYELPEQHQNKMLVTFKNALPLSIAYDYNQLGNFERALDWLNIAEKYLDKKHNFYPGLLYQERGKVYLSLNQLEKGREDLERSIRCFTNSSSGKESNFLLDSYMYLSNIYLAKQDTTKALNSLRYAEKISISRQNKSPLYYQFGRIYLEKDDLSNSLQFGQKALTENKRKGIINHFEKGRIISLIGQALAKQKKWSLALDTIQIALQHVSSDFTRRELQHNPNLNTSTTKLDLLKTLVLKAEVLANYHYYQQNAKEDFQYLEWSLETYLQAIKLIKILRAEYGDDDVKEYLSAQSFPIFEEALGVATQLYRLTNKAEYLEHAFAICEVSKALSLFENLKDIEAKEFSNLPDTLIDRERQLKIQIAQLELNLSNIGASERKQEIQDLLFEVKEQYKRLITLFKTDYPDYFNLKYDIETVPIEQLQNSLREEETLVEYFYGEKNIYIFTISKEKKDFIILPNSEALVKNVQDFIKATSSRRGLNSGSKISRFQKNSFQLYQQLIESASIDNKNLIIIPDGILHLVPFAALTTDTLATKNPSELAYLVKQHTISTNFSGSVLHYQRQHQPIQQPDNSSILVISPKEFPSNSQLSLDSASIAQLFKGKVRIERSLTKEKVLPLLNEGYENIFFFTHASTGNGNPFLQITNDTIYLSELYATPMTSNLVLLGACETGLGENQKGEGVLSLARGFAYQNIPNTVMTLWRVQDEAALQISLSFLRYHLQERLPPAEALRHAQLDFIGDANRVGRPFLWSGFVSSGN